MNFSGITCRVTVTSHLVNHLCSALIIWLISGSGLFVNGPFGVCGGLWFVYLAIGDGFELDKISLLLSVIFELLAD